MIDIPPISNLPKPQKEIKSKKTTGIDME